jgi:hypothetical protein
VGSDASEEPRLEQRDNDEPNRLVALVGGRLDWRLPNRVGSLLHTSNRPRCVARQAKFVLQRLERVFATILEYSTN